MLRRWRDLIITRREILGSEAARVNVLLEKEASKQQITTV